ncbi:MAG TPA: PHP domain-containing protein [Candidatus Limnocylindrales bacterium]|nr:PHP domain-containing protein [Candidatus Limnocylindrales bacterium]
MAEAAFAELHCHSHFSFLDGGSSPDELVERALELELAALALTDHQGLYGAVRFTTAAQSAGVRPVLGVEIELLDPAVPDPAGIVVPRARAWRPGRRVRAEPDAPPVVDGRPLRPRPERPRLPGHRRVVKEDHRGVGAAERGPHLVLLARDPAGWTSLCRLISRANLAGSKAVPHFTHALLEAHAEGLIVLSGCRDGEIARRLLAGDREGAVQAARWHASRFGTGDAAATSGFLVELSHHLRPEDDWLVGELARLAEELGLPTVVTNDVHYARPEDRELHDVLTAIRHGRTLDTLGHLRRADGESFLKSGAELLALPPGERDGDVVVERAWRSGIAAAVEVAGRCAVDLGFERYRFPGFEVPRGETPFSHLSELCWEGARRRYHPLTAGVVKQLAHELDVIEKTGLSEFFLICWDLMRFAKSRGIPAQGRGSAADSIVAYVLGITRVDPIRHELLFERFINEGRTAYPDVDIDFSSERREEVIQYVYGRYGAEHTGMVCNLVTYRARSAVREVGYALGFPRTLVDRVAKALETYDSVMVRRDLEAEGGFGQFFARPGDEAGPGDRPGHAEPPTRAEERGLTDAMGQLRHAAGGWIGGGRAPRAEGDPLPAAGGPLPAAGGPRPAEYLRGLPDEDSGRTTGSRLAGQANPGVGIPPGHAEDGNGRSGALSALRSVHGNPHRYIQAGDDEGGPGDSPVSIRWLREGPPSRELERGRERERGHALEPTRTVERPRDLVPVDPESGMPVGPARRIDLPVDSGPRSRSTVGMSDWERWLEMCARIDGFPRHLSIHSGGMLITAAPLIDIAPIERATMVDRVVVQFDKRDVETMKLIKLDLLGLGMLAAIDECVQLIEHDCGVCLDLDRIPEEIPEVFRMLQAADTVGVFQVESRAQMQTLPKSQPRNLDDLVVEVAIIRPGPIQGNAVHPYLRRKQGLEPVTYLHPSLEPILHDSLGVILYQEQVMRIAIDVAGFTPAGSDAFRRAMGTWRSTREMEKLHAQFVDGCLAKHGMPREDAEELFRQCAAFASFGFAKSHAAAFARTAYESSFLKLFYPAQFVVGLINAQPMGFYPVEVLVNDAKRHGVTVLPVDVNRSTYRTATEWVGRPGEPLPEGCGVEARATAVESSGCVVPEAGARTRWAAESAIGWGVRLGLHLVKGIGEEHAARLDAELARGPYASLADVVERTALPEEIVERLIRSGALDSLGRPRRELLWQLREVARPTKGPARIARRAAGRPMDLRLPATEAPALPALTETERLGDAYAVVGLDTRRQAVGLFRPVLDRLGAATNASLADRRPGRIRIGGLVVTRQHPMTARGTVFLALEDETGMVNVTLWPSAWQRLRGVVRRHALLLVDGELQREANVVNVIAREVRSLVDVAAELGGPEAPAGVRQIGHAGMRRLG